MSKRRKVKEEVDSDDDENELGIKQWAIKSVMVAFTLLLLIYFFENFIRNYFGVDTTILVDSLIAITIILCIAFTHEMLHYWKAVRLGYKPKWWRTRFRMGFEIGSHSKRGKWMADKKTIASAPYYFAVPFSVIIAIIGFHFHITGLLVAGIGSLILHAITLPSEGKE